MPLMLLICRILIYLKILPFLFLVTITIPFVSAESFEINVVPVCDFVKDPQRFLDKPITIAGTLSMLKDVSQLQDRFCELYNDIYVDFSQNWEKQTKPNILKQLKRLRKKSGIKFPYKHSSSVLVNSQNANVIAKGIILLNPKYKQKKNNDNDIPFSINIMDTESYRNHAPYLLIVDQVLKVN